MKKTILPIGTVVAIKNNPGIKFMIVGYFPTSREGERRTYSAIRYPMGVYDNRVYFFFNNSDISEIAHMGYVDEDYENMTIFIEREKSLEIK